MIALTSYCYASSIGISATASSLTVGGSATITVSGNDAIGRVNISSSNSNVVSVSTSSLWVEGSNSFRITAKSVGTATITITPTDMANGSGGTVSLGAKSITIYSKAVHVDTRSTNNNLSALSVEGYTISFDKNNTAYLLDVDYTVDKINVNATAEDSKSKVTVEGNTSLAPGENIVKVIVTAENTAQKVYQIKVNRAKNPEDINANLKSLIISNATMKNSFSVDALEYMCEDISADIEKLDISYITEIEGAKVEITGNEKLNAGINHIKIKVTSKDGSATKEYVITVYKSNQISSLKNVNDKDNTTMFESVTNWVNKNKLLTVSFFVILLLLITVIILAIKIKKSKKNYDNDDDEAINIQSKIEESSNDVADTIKSENESEALPESLELNEDAQVEENHEDILNQDSQIITNTDPVAQESKVEESVIQENNLSDSSIDLSNEEKTSLRRRSVELNKKDEKKNRILNFKNKSNKYEE
jgi:hypothetical protein